MLLAPRILSVCIDGRSRRTILLVSIAPSIFLFVSPVPVPQIPSACIYGAAYGNFIAFAAAYQYFVERQGIKCGEDSAAERAQQVSMFSYPGQSS